VLVSGKVLAGSMPIVGASVQVYSAGTTGNGTGAKSLLSVPVTTDSTGAFAVTSGLSCSSAEPMYYLVARGGQIGSSAANAAIALTAAVGDCSKLSTSTTTAFTVNEVTTVAFTWSLSQFLAQGAFVGTASTNATGLANAFATAANLADTSTGKSPGALFPANGRSPAAKINTLANLLNNCIVVPSSCGALFSATTVSGTSAPTNTLDAAFQLARNPGKNVGVLYTQSVSGKAFAPILAAAPSDWTLSIGFTGGGMSAPTGIGVDSKGNIWVASYTGVASKFTPTGLPVFASGITGSGLQTSYGLAVDSSDNVWIPNEDSPRTVNTGFGSVTVLNSNGQPLSGSTGYTAGGLSYPISLAIDPNGAVWVVNYHNSSLTKLSNSGAVLSGSAGYGAPSLAFIVAIAIDANHNAWIGNQNDLTVTRVSSDGSQSLAVACCNGPQGVAIDQRGNIWATNFYGDSVSQFASNGTIISSGYTGGGLSRPQGIAIDGAGTVWALSLRSTSSAASPTLTQLAGSGAASPGAILSPSAGWLADANLLQPYSLAIDASGNIWLTNFVNDAQYTNSNTITEVIGLASPVKTPVIGPAQAP
jgi:sugar lactone lactonase YvrE